MDAQIATLHCEYLVNAGDPLVAERVHQVARTDLATALEAELAPVLDVDPAVYLIRDLVAEVRLDTRAPNLPREWARQLGAAVVAAITHGGRDHDAVVRFADEAAYLASYLLARVRGSAWDEWYYRPLGRFHHSPVSVVIREAVPAQDVVPVLAALHGQGALTEVLDALDREAVAELASASQSSVDCPGAPRPLLGQASTMDPLVGVALRFADACSLWTGTRQPALAVARRQQRPSSPDWLDPDSLSEIVADLLCYLAEMGAVRLPPAEIPTSLRAELEWLNLPLLEARLRQRPHESLPMEQSRANQEEERRTEGFPPPLFAPSGRPAGPRTRRDRRRIAEHATGDAASATSTASPGGAPGAAGAEGADGAVGGVVRARAAAHVGGTCGAPAIGGMAGPAAFQGAAGGDGVEGAGVAGDAVPGAGVAVEGVGAVEGADGAWGAAAAGAVGGVPGVGAAARAGRAGVAVEGVGAVEGADGAWGAAAAGAVGGVPGVGAAARAGRAGVAVEGVGAVEGADGAWGAAAAGAVGGVPGVGAAARAGRAGAVWGAGGVVIAGGFGVSAPRPADATLLVPGQAASPSHLYSGRTVRHPEIARLLTLVRRGRASLGELVRVLLGFGLPEPWAVALARGEITWSELPGRASGVPRLRTGTRPEWPPPSELDALLSSGELNTTSGSRLVTPVTGSVLPDLLDGARSEGVNFALATPLVPGQPSRTHIPLFDGVSLTSAHAPSSSDAGPETPGADDGVATTQQNISTGREDQAIGPEETAVLRALLHLVTNEAGAAELRTRLAAAGPGPYSLLLLRAALAARHPEWASSPAAEEITTHVLRRWAEALALAGGRPAVATPRQEDTEPDDVRLRRSARANTSATRALVASASTARGVPETGIGHDETGIGHDSDADRLVAALVSARASTGTDATDSPCAGVLLLLRAVVDLRLPGILTRAGFGHALTATPLALATRLTGAPPDDPAVLAFAGMPTGDPEELLLPWLEITEDESAAMRDAVLDAVLAQRVVDAPDQLDDGDVLEEGRLGVPEADQALGVLALAVVRAWSRWLGKFAGSSVPYLVTHFARRPGRVRLSERELVVELAPGPLDVVVRLAGYDAPLAHVPWLDGRMVTYRMEAA